MTTTDTTPAGVAPDIGFDYRTLLADLLAAVSDGQQERAIDLVGRAAGGVTMAGGWDELRKQFAVIYGGGGTYGGHELLGSKRLSSRLFKIYAVGYWERVAVLFAVTLGRTTGDWRLMALSLSDKSDDLEALAPFRPIHETASDTAK